uniref:Candidate secreted effector n=1 Tax=Meloidogyne incognita TaxID=6306 RepID=A0A914L5H8_MELIC
MLVVVAWWLACFWWLVALHALRGGGIWLGIGSTPCTVVVARLHVLPRLHDPRRAATRSASGMDGMDKAECPPMDGISF